MVGIREMRKALARQVRPELARQVRPKMSRRVRLEILRSIIALAAVLAFSSMAMPQDQAKPGSKGSLYNGNRLKTDPTPGGPAPVHDMNGSWAGNLVPTRLPVPPLTPLGQKLASLNHSEPEAGTGKSNDPGNTCDPLGTPRNLEGSGSLAGISFATMPDRIAVLHEYQRIWRYAWMDGKHELPKKIDTKDGLPSRWYGYSVGHWDGDNTLVIDTTGVSDQTWLDKNGHPHTVNALVEERYTRTDHNHMQMTVTVDDPTLYTKPFALSKNQYRWIPDQEEEEQICVPSEMLHYMDLVSKPSFGVDEHPK
jgi:hypothetical protein